MQLRCRADQKIAHEYEIGIVSFYGISAASMWELEHDGIKPP